MSSGGANRLYSVWGSSGSDVFAVGIFVLSHTMTELLQLLQYPPLRQQQLSCQVNVGTADLPQGYQGFPFLVSGEFRQ